MCEIWSYIAHLSPDDFNKIVLALVALIALFSGPVVQFRIAKRQVAMQEQIANRQVAMQEQIAFRQVSMQEEITNRQTETQRQIAARQISDSIATRRQVWIDELRKDFAEYLTLVARLQELKRPAKDISEADQKLIFDEMAAALARGHELGVRIKLRLNPKEEQHNKLVELLTSLSNACPDPHPNETDEQWLEYQKVFREARDNVVSHLQTILKYEWERVKRGEI